MSPAIRPGAISHPNGLTVDETRRSLLSRGPLADWILGDRDEIVLASASPRRRELLERLGVPARVEPVSVDERFPDGVDPAEGARRVALRKVHAARDAGASGLVLAADTVVLLGPAVLGKPRDAEEARAMLGELSGRMHVVATGVALADERGRVASGVETTDVWFRSLSAGEIEDYVRTGEPLDKAGAYGIQGLGILLVREIRGDYANVVGLPVGLLLELARRFPHGRSDRRR